MENYPACKDLESEFTHVIRDYRKFFGYRLMYRPKSTLHSGLNTHISQPFAHSYDI